MEYRIENAKEQKIKSYDFFISHSSKDSASVQKLIKYENNRFIYSGKVNHDGNERIIKLDGVTGEVVE